MELKYDRRAVAVLDWEANLVLAVVRRQVPVEAIAFFKAVRLGLADAPNATTGAHFDSGVVGIVEGKDARRCEFKGANFPAEDVGRKTSFDAAEEQRDTNAAETLIQSVFKKSCARTRCHSRCLHQADAIE